MESVKHLADGYSVYKLDYSKKKWNLDWLFKFLRGLAVVLFVGAGYLSAGALMGFQ